MICDVIPAESARAGIQKTQGNLDFRLRGNDENRLLDSFNES